MNDELRDALRRFTASWMGEEEIQRRMTQPEGGVDASNDARRLPEGPKTREQVLDFFAGLEDGLAQFFEAYHVENGRYPVFEELFPPGGPVIGKLSDMR